ncbi:hypothetical protein SAMN05216296_2454 [Pseudomonas pohangensis]|uniref:Uncharacterized protein n=1 Tax=Pseudomonas pohangensis TaxID=364197 RepID=A0A1H2GPV2_9PSED|nr:DUF6641 family protein [Pseudomonas pohangensis]SDU21627.1 hypothetical protein SAMN05216296_2454 [Pseudomonas pohangensis]
MKTTNLLSSLNLTVKPVVGSVDPVLNRRSKLLLHLEEQRAMAWADLTGETHEVLKDKWVQNAETGTKTKVRVPKRLKRWFFACNSKHFLEVRYGNKPLELAKGKFAIEVGELKDVPTVIETVAQAVNAGELDAMLMAVTKPSKKAAS